MREESESYFEENEIEELIVRYEEMLISNNVQYFDVFEFENIVEYYIDNFELNKALKAIHIAFQLHPNSINLLLKKCQLLLEDELPYEAIKILEQIQKIEKNNYEVYLLHGHAFCLLNRIIDAEIKFNYAINISLDEADEVYINIASILMRTEKYSLAIKYLEKAILLYPKNFDFLYEIASCYEQLGDINNSIKYYNYLLDIEPYTENAWFNLGLLYEKIGKYDKSIEAYEFVTAINENYSIAYLNKGNVNLNAGNYKAAIKSYKEYISINDDCPEIYCYIGECYEKLAEYKYAKEYYQKAINFDHTISDAWFGLGIVEMYLDNHFKSIEYIKKAIQIENNNSDYWYSLGKVKLKLELFNESKNAFLKAIELDVYDYESWMLLAEIFWNEENADKAITVLLEGYKYNNSIAEYNYKLAAYLLATNQAKNAIKYFKTAYKDDKGGYEIIFNYAKENQIPLEIKSIIKKLF